MLRASVVLRFRSSSSGLHRLASPGRRHCRIRRRITVIELILFLLFVSRFALALWHDIIATSGCCPQWGATFFFLSGGSPLRSTSAAAARGGTLGLAAHGGLGRGGRGSLRRRRERRRAREVHLGALGRDRLGVHPAELGDGLLAGHALRRDREAAGGVSGIAVSRGRRRGQQQAGEQARRRSEAAISELERAP